METCREPIMEADDWESSSGGGLSEDELCLDEDIYATSGSLPKLQFRKKTSKARWNDEIGMAEVIEKKGSIWVSTGITRSSTTYCLLEEALFLAEIGSLTLLNDDDTCLSLDDIYGKVAEEKGGCYMELCMVYRHLKFLGYILKRHDIPWSLKNMKSICRSSSNGNHESDSGIGKESEDKTSIIERFGDMKINEVRPMFDVYLPNSKFRKTTPGDPDFILCSTGACPPTKAEIEVLESKCGNIPLKFCHVEPGRISFFAFDKVELPQLS